MKLILFLAVYIFHSGLGFNTIPSYIKLCSRSDPKFNECALKNGREALSKFIEGDPAFMIPNFNPFNIEHVSLDTGEAVKLYATNMTLYGLAATELKDFKWDFENKIVTMHVFVPQLDFVATYNMKGRILIMNLSGNGPMNNTHLENDAIIKIHYILKKDKHDQDHMYVENVDVALTEKKIIFRFGNLLNNPQLSDRMNLFLNENWETLKDELSPSIMRALEAIVKSVVNPIAAKVPYDNIVKP